MNHEFPILIVEDNPVSLKILEMIIKNAGYEVIPARDGSQALNILKEKFIPVVITDWVMPEMDGLELCRKIRQINFSGYVYIIFFTTKDSKGDIVAGLEAGADEYLTKPVEPSELFARLNTANRILNLESSLKKKNEEIRILSITDPLTKAFNRVYLNEQFPLEIKKFFRYRQPLSMIMCDIDKFKKINDRYGHSTGDLLLHAFAQRLKGSVRDGIDWIVRFGGDEFLVVMPNIDLPAACSAAERLAAVISEENFYLKNREIRVTSTFGVSGIDPIRQDNPIQPEALIEQVDQFLHQAKDAGGNRIQTISLPQPPVFLTEATEAKVAMP
jgi:two-component system, cell cycle response regulator